MLLCALLCASVAMAQVAPTSIFQLNGNAANSISTCTYGQPCDYWNLLNGTGNNSSTGAPGNNSSAGHSSIRTYVSGAASTPAFTGGGSKDSNLISQWSYSTTPTPNKDTLNAAYAAGYQIGGNFEIIFGADRLSPNGDANIGIWFFQKAVAANGTGGFTGAHVDHDIFLISAFTGGGGVSTIEALEWDHTCSTGVKNPAVGQCADTNLRLLANVGLANVCTATSPTCAITNAAATTTTWEGQIAAPLFFEGGVDITYLLNQVGITNLPCFASFLVETRSSQSTTAVLKDFIAGNFPVCSVSITKNCDTQNTFVVDPPGNLVQYAFTGTVTNTGIGAIYNVTLTDSFPTNSTLTSISGAGTFTAPSVFVFNNPLPPNTSITYSGTYRNPALSGLVNNIGVAAGSSPNDTSLGVTSSASLNQCSPTPTPGLTITKSCLVRLKPVATVGVVIQVDNTYKVCNNGQLQITGITVTDNQTLLSGSTTVASGLSLDAPAQASSIVPNCTTLTASYRPPTCTTDNSGGTCSFIEQGLITTGTAALTGQSVQGGTITVLPASANCHLCAGSGACSAGTP